ncbi:MAG: O-antigen ligase family protein, partial [Oscillospiraceae bacterium]|nr:O-antigen ligase family protein [Oscillospiraceae bacterium]
MLRLDSLLAGSIFARPYLWCFFTATLAPLVPTKIVIALAVVSALSMFLAYGLDENRRIAYSPSNRFALLYIFIYAVATAASVTLKSSIYVGAVSVCFMFFCIVLQSAVESRWQLDGLIYAVVICGAAVSLFGIYQYVFGITGSGSWIDDDMFSNVKMRVYSTLQNPNVLAEYLLLVIPVSFALILCKGSKLRRSVFAVITALMLLCLVLTYSRGGWLGLIIAMAVFLVMLDRRFIVLGIFGVAALVVVMPQTIIARFSSIGNMADTSTSYRVSIWLGTLAMLKDYWLCGIGPGTDAFNKVYPYYCFNAISAPHSHNLYLQIICDCGITGIIVFCLMLLAWFRNLFSAIRRETDKDSKILQMALSSSMIGFLVQSATDYSFYNYRVMLMFWAFIALGSLAARRSSLRGE